MKYVCNPINMEYKYQIFDINGQRSASREAADPSLILFKDKYYLFPSMTTGFLASDNLTEWEFHPLKDMPVYDYAPDVRVIGEYLYFSASKRNENCSFFRTKDPIKEEFEEIPGTFPFWDPHLFEDEDGKVYFYWGCSNVTPIYGVEMNLEDMTPKTEWKELIFGNEDKYGFERTGENHVAPRTEEEIEATLAAYLSQMPDASKEQEAMLRMYLSNAPYIEGPWMTKHNGKYYLQYAFPGTQYNVYGDGTYVSDSPLGPFKLAKNNPFSYKPGGFIPGAGHGSTLEDKDGNLWHASTMRISINHQFERRLGIWPAGFDKDGELFCNQRFGDWPMKIESGKIDPWQDPEWMLLSFNKLAKSSSETEGKEAHLVTDENVQTWWKAKTNKPGEWIEVDLEDEHDVRAIQINFADDETPVKLPEEKVEFIGEGPMSRYIDTRTHYTRWILEGSLDGENYFVIEDKSKAETDLSHDFIVREDGIKARYIRCTITELPYGQNPCVSGLRVFGKGQGDLPKKASNVAAVREGDLDLLVNWEESDATGYNVLWGHQADKMYHSYMVLGKNEVKVGALITGEPVFVRVDTFNEVGITEGDVIEVK